MRRQNGYSVASASGPVVCQAPTAFARLSPGARRGAVACIGGLLLGVALLGIGGCAAVAPADPPAATAAVSLQKPIPLFSAAAPGQRPIPGWVDWIIHPTKKRTQYAIVDQAGLSVLRAQADSSASGLAAVLNIDPLEQSILEWRWRTESVIDGADNAVAATEDAPLRLLLAFDGNKQSLPARDRLFAERVKLISGRELPYATLMYIWGNNHAVESILASPHTDRIRKLVVENSPEQSRQWRSYRRDIVADYQRAFGSPPGRLVGVALMTDTDNTASQVMAYYGDIRLLPSAAQTDSGLKQGARLQAP
jgi:hypothetical protein